MKRLAPSVVLLIGLGLTLTAAAQTPPASLITCAHLPQPSERLRCYDTQMLALGVPVGGPAAEAPVAAATAPPALPTPAAPLPPPRPAALPAPVPSQAAAEAPPAPPAATFGAEDLKQSARPKEAESDKVLMATIASVKEVRPKLFLIVLTNGQIWMQEGTQITMFFKAGYQARIEKGLFGDYRMSTAETGAKNLVRVTRIQ